MAAVTAKISDACTSADDAQKGPFFYRDFFRKVKTLYFKSDPRRAGEYAVYAWDEKTGTLTISNFDLGIPMTTDLSWSKLLKAHLNPAVRNFND